MKKKGTIFVDLVDHRVIIGSNLLHASDIFLEKCFFSMLENHNPGLGHVVAILTDLSMLEIYGVEQTLPLTPGRFARNSIYLNQSTFKLLTSYYLRKGKEMPEIKKRHPQSHIHAHMISEICKISLDPMKIRIMVEDCFGGKVSKIGENGDNIVWKVLLQDKSSVIFEEVVKHKFYIMKEGYLKDSSKEPIPGFGYLHDEKLRNVNKGYIPGI